MLYNIIDCEGQQLRIVNSFHVDLTSGHLGVKKTVGRVNVRKLHDVERR